MKIVFFGTLVGGADAGNSIFFLCHFYCFIVIIVLTYW